jgi:hypothetical protein
MSLTPIIFKNSLGGLGEKLRFGLKVHGHEIIVGSAVIAISFAIALAVTGDFNDAFAKASRR